jgi:peroxiredoxin
MKKILNVLLFIILSCTLTIAQKYKTKNEVKGAQIGDTVSDFMAINQDNQIYSLSDGLKKGPVVLMFYRGQWCPVCNRYLKNLQDSLQLIYDKGATVIAISPEKPEYLNMTKDKTGAKFTLLYDEGFKISEAFDVLFKPGNFTIFTYNFVADANLKKAQSDDSQRLPIPATFIISTNHKIIWRQFNPNYKIRAYVKEILNHLQ